MTLQKYPTVDAQISPEGQMEILSKLEVSKLLDRSNSGLYPLFRKCSLAVLNCGNESDDGNTLLEMYPNFHIEIILRERGIKLDLKGAPAHAFVDGVMIKGIREHLFSVLRDIIYTSEEIIANPRFALDNSEGLTNAVFHILRNAGILKVNAQTNLVVCWGGHSIGPVEYEYTKDVGYQLGLRRLDICTGCGPGAMKGPMKGAAIGHAKQRQQEGRYLGFSEPGIIAAESPNPIVNSLVILPDIEKRLEAFVRGGHAIVVFAGGAGTAEEILYLLGILLHPSNREMPFPVVLTGPKSSAAYFEQIDDFIGATLGQEAQQLYKIIIDDPAAVAQYVSDGTKKVREYRKAHGDAYYFNWRLKIDLAFQRPFAPTHENMESLRLHKGRAVHELAADLRRAFSGIVAGNVKEDGIAEIRRNGKFRLFADDELAQRLDMLLAAFVEQHRMKLPGKAYTPCYEIVSSEAQYSS
jgi:hypothetical protein